MGKVIPIAILIFSLVFYMVFFSGDKFDPNTIKHKRVLVTGASSGIGEQLAYYYSKLGARLVITARRENLLLNVSRKCKELGAQQVEIVVADMAKAADRSKVIEKTEEYLGGLQLLILNHAALIQGWWHGTPANLTTLEKIFHVNCLSYADLASKSLRMLTESRGSIGVISSGFGEIGSARTTVYSAYKFALHGFFSALRQELIFKRTGVSVTIIVLGPVASDAFLDMRESEFAHVPMGFIASPTDAAKAIAEGVSLRYYKVRFNTFTKMLTTVNDLFPDFAEDSLTKILLDDQALISRVFAFVWSTFYK